MANKLKNLILLKGKPNIGKTITMKMLYDILREKKNFKELEYNCEEKDSFRSIMENGNLKIGIASYGDNPKQVQDALIEFTSKNCDVGICVCRSKGRVRNIPKKYVDREKNIVCVNKIFDDDYKTHKDNNIINILNDYDLKKLLKEVEKLF